MKVPIIYEHEEVQFCEPFLCCSCIKHILFVQVFLSYAEIMWDLFLVLVKLTSKHRQKHLIQPPCHVAFLSAYKGDPNASHVGSDGKGIFLFMKMGVFSVPTVQIH